MKQNAVSWDYVILWPLRLGEADLSEIYTAIDDELRDGSINPRLFEIELKWGERPKYYHTVRSCMSSLRKRGMVERVHRGRYRITDTGMKHLAECSP